MFENFYPSKEIVCVTPAPSSPTGFISSLHTSGQTSVHLALSTSSHPFDAVPMPAVHSSLLQLLDAARELQATQARGGPSDFTLLDNLEA